MNKSNVMDSPLDRLLHPGLGLQEGKDDVSETGALMNQNYGPRKQLEKMNSDYGELFSPTQLYFTFLPHERS